MVPVGSDDSGLFYYRNPQNWEMLVKVLDACSFSQRFWVFAAATTVSLLWTRSEIPTTKRDN